MRRAPAFALASLAALALAALIATGLGLGELAGPSPDPSPASATGPEPPIPLDAPGMSPATLPTTAPEPKAAAPQPAAQAQPQAQADVPETPLFDLEDGVERPATGLCGRVVNEVGAPIPGAWVSPLGEVIDDRLHKGLGGSGWLPDPEEPEGSARCDAQGRYAFAAEPGRLRVAALAPNHLGAVSAWGEVRAGALTRLPDIRLRSVPSGRLALTIRHADGRPYEGRAKLVTDVVTVAGSRFSRMEDIDLDASGRGVTEPWPATRYLMEVETRFGRVNGVKVNLSPGEVTEQLIVIPETPTLTLRLLDAETGAPVPNLSLTWRGTDMKLERWAESDEAGEALLYGLSPGHWRVRVESEVAGLSVGGEAPQLVFEWDLSSADLGATRTLRVHAAPMLAVTVLGADGQPAAGARVLVFSPNVPRVEGFARDDGRAELKLTKRRDQWLSAAHPELGEAELEAPGGFAGELRVTLQPYQSLRGRVLAEGAPVAGALIEASGHSARSQADGGFELLVSPGQERLRVCAPGFVDTHAEIPRPLPELFEVELERGRRIEGRILGIDSEVPWVVEAEPLDGSEDEPARAFADEAGRFVVGGLSDREYRVVARATRGGGLTAPAVTRPRAELELRAHPLIKLRGLALRPDGAPYLNAYLHARGEAWSDVTWAGSDGRYELILPAEQRRITIRAPQTAPLELELPASRPGAVIERDLRFREGARLSGRILGPDGLPRAVDLTIEGLEPSGGYEYSRSDGQGKFQVTGLDPGRYQVLWSIDMREWVPIGEALIRADETTDIGDLTLPQRD